MDVRVLGPFEVVDDGRDLTPARPKHRALLALLFLRANEVVSADELVEALWGPEPPDTAHKALHGHVSALRKLLGAEVIETRPPGYALRMRPEESDLGRFEALLAEAGREADPHARSKLLSDALGLFRGEPLADFRYDDFARENAAGLEELRLTALEARVEADLELGRDAELVPELERLVLANPLRERLRAQLMLALYRAGRQADALHVYQEGRQVLAEELGLDPGPALRRLERQILEHDARLAPSDRRNAERRNAALEPSERAEAAVGRALPTGTVTFLFTDVEGSTQVLHDVGAERYAELLREHRRVVREAVARHEGVEVDTQGDALFVAFATAPAAVAAAAEAQAGLRQGPIRVRMGVHTGTPFVTDGGYVGGDVHHAARVAAAGHGGQILLSQSTCELVDAEVRDLGLHRLKGSPKLQRLYQLGLENFPPLPTRADTNLPSPPTVFVGRHDELGQVSVLLGRPETRLVTITGAGGSGKTRLALRVAEHLQSRFPDGIWFVDFAPLDDAALVLATIARAVGAPDDVAAHLRGKRLLLVLDTFERVGTAALDIAGLLSACPGLKVLATSREPLHLAGEQEFELQSLSLGDAVALFRQRARLVRHTVQSSVIDEEICRRLDCLPLAIELAAARIKVLEAEELLMRLGHPLDLPPAGPRDLPKRHRTLRATIEWSHALLSPEEQELLARLSVFAGGFDVAGAEQIFGADLNALHSLVDKSFVVREGQRLRMLDTIREFATERLEERGRADDARRRHADHMRQLAAEFEARVGTWEAHLSDLRPEDDNLRAAVEWLVEAQPENALQVVVHLARYWALQDRHRECDYWLAKAIETAPAADRTLRSAALRLAGDAAFVLGDEERANRLFNEALAIAADAGAKREMAAALINLGRAEEGLALYREIDWRPGVAVTLHRLADAARDRGDFTRARPLYAESVAEWRRLGIAWGLGNVLHGFADCALDQGLLDEATALYREALAIAVEGPSELRVANCLAGLAAVAAVRRRKAFATRLWAAVESIESTNQIQLERRQHARYDRLVQPMLRSAPGTRAADEALTLPAAVAYALKHAH